MNGDTGVFELMHDPWVLLEFQGETGLPLEIGQEPQDFILIKVGEWTLISR